MIPALSFIPLVTMVAGAQQPPAATYQLEAVKYVGTKRYAPDDVTRLSGLAVGKPIRVADLQPAAEKLAASGLFTTLQYRYAVNGRQMTVTFEIEEAAWTVPVVFDNFVWFTDEELTAAVRREVPSFDGTLPTTEGSASLVTRALGKLLASRQLPGQVGLFPQADLKGKKVDASAMKYLFKVTDPAPKVCSVLVKGASPAIERDLLAAAGSLTGSDYSRFYVKGMSEGTLLDIYHRSGFWRAAFAAPQPAAEGASCPGVSLVLSVNEGPQFAFDKAEWRGNAALSAADLDALLAIPAGKVADGSLIDAGLLRVKKAYAKHGYLMASSRMAPRLDDGAKTAAFEVHVAEGPQFRMGTVEFVGLAPSDAESLSKKWKLAAGDVYDDTYPGEFMKEIRAARRAGPSEQMQLDQERHVVNLRFVFK